MSALVDKILADVIAADRRRVREAVREIIAAEIMAPLSDDELARLRREFAIVPPVRNYIAASTDDGEIVCVLRMPERRS